MTTYAPYGYKRVHVQDGAAKRPKLELNPPADAVVRRVFDMVLQGKSILDVTKTLNAEGIPTTNGKKWLKTTIHTMLSNEAYTGTLVWGANAKDGQPPVRVEDAHPAIVSKRDFQRARKLLRSRAPKKVNPRRASSPYLLSGIAKCETCGKAMTAAEAKSGKYTYYICHSLLKRGKGTCKTPRLNAKSFEKLIVNEIRENVLTESNIRDLVKLLDEEMDGVARDQRERLETIEEELEDVKKRLGRIWNHIETTDTEMADASDRIREHRERKEKLEVAAEEARGLLKERRQFLDSADTIAAFAAEMSGFLKTSELTETKAFVGSFVKEVVVKPGRAAIVYSIPTPEDSPIGGADFAEVALNGRVMNSVRHGGPGALRIRCTGPAAGALFHVKHTLHCDGHAEFAAADGGINSGTLHCFQRCVLQEVVHSGRGADRFANENQAAQADSRVVSQLHGLGGHVFYGQLTGLHFQGLRVVQTEMNSVEAGEVASRLNHVVYDHAHLVQVPDRHRDLVVDTVADQLAPVLVPVVLVFGVDAEAGGLDVPLLDPAGRQGLHQGVHGLSRHAAGLGHCLGHGLDASVDGGDVGRGGHLAHPGHPDAGLLTVGSLVRAFHLGERLVHALLDTHDLGSAFVGRLGGGIVGGACAGYQEQC